MGNLSIEMWAGVECTVNRVGDRFFDQLERNGHAERIEDLDRFAALGVRALRYPVLWERTAPDGTHCDFRWADERIARLRELGVRPIVGLVHHGSGPSCTSLVDAAFPEKLAAYARRVAERYPHVEEWTPVNEPLTTARFSGLYGHWYPHGRSPETFFRALIQECRGTVLAMRAIRETVPNAQLVQTEDLGRVFSTPLLAYQAAYENIRRFLSLDLLFGRVDSSHPMWRELIAAGIGESELRFFVECDVRPNVVGLNYYVTSDRWLDERKSHFPAQAHGGNGRHRYADVEAVRVRPRGIVGHEGVLLEAWERYRAPVAITEAHLGCSREEQVRWLVDAWEGAHAARTKGADVRAVTAWSLLGAFDWNSLLVREESFYESGAFDVRAGAPRPTAIARAIEALAKSGRHDHPLLDAPGWWRRPERILYSVGADAEAALGPRVVTAPQPALSVKRRSPRPILITGGGGLARALARECAIRALPAIVLGRSDLDASDAEAVARTLDALRPWAIINAAGIAHASGAHDELRLLRDNAHVAAILAAAAAARDLPLVTFSNEQVFDGSKGAPYSEGDARSPLTPLGRSKARAEEEVTRQHQGALIVRTSALFGPTTQRDFVRDTIARLDAGELITADGAVTVSPTYAPDLADATLNLLLDEERGIWNVAHHSQVTWAELFGEVARLAGLDARRITTAPSSASTNFALHSERGHFLSGVEDGLGRYFREHAVRELARSVA